MAITKAQQKAVSKYVANNYDRIEIKVPKGRKATVEAHAKARGESINSMMNALLMDATGITETEWKQPPADLQEDQEEGAEP